MQFCNLPLYLGAHYSRLKHEEGYGTKLFTVKLRVEGSQSFKRNHVLFVKVRENLAAPWVDVNTGLQVPFSSSIQVTANQLSALDLDSEAKELRFKVFIASPVLSERSLQKG